MTGDPLREVLQKVVAERQEKLDFLRSARSTEVDAARRTQLDAEIEIVQSELQVSQRALQQAPAIERSINEDGLLVDSEQLVQAKAPPSRAALEAQVRELQAQLLDLAKSVEVSGLSPDPREVLMLEATRQKLSAAMQAIDTLLLPGFEGELPPKPTIAQQAEADNLIRQSRVAKMRGQNQAATELLRKASEAAPGAVSVLEALGDDLMERGLAQPAAETYAKALALSNRDAAIERKYADAVSRSKGSITFEEALQMKFGDSPFASADVASSKSAAVISFFLPGVGQMVLGEYAKGAAFLLAWLALIGWAFSGFHSLRPGAGFSATLVIPIVGALVVQVVAAWACRSGQAGQLAGTLRKANGERPRPPVDLPFE